MSIPARQAALWSLFGLLFCLLVIAFLAAIPAFARASDQVIQIGTKSLTRPDSSASHANIANERDTLSYSVFLPLIFGSDTCAPISTESYSTLTVDPPPTDRPAEQHADLNLALRGYISTVDYLGLIDVGGPVDVNAPQLYGLFSDNRTATVSSVSQVYDWNWACNCRGVPIVDPAVSLAGLVVTPTEVIRVPNSGYNIGTPLSVPQNGVARDRANNLTDAYEVLVLYASENRITIKYTRDDNVVSGYTVHLENICVEPRLLALYRQWNDAGRSQLPALKGGQALGRAPTNEIGVAIRDDGTFMDPRSRTDWWQGR
jgi:hypothetical protein